MKRIVLGYDASPAAERALERVIELATIFDAPVVVASIAPVHELVPLGAGAYVDPADSPALHDRMARDAVAKLTEQGITARPVIGLGDTPETLVELTEASEADLIVVGMSSRDLFSRLFGGVSDEIAREARCDVLLVH